MKAATKYALRVRNFLFISIHAAREGGDCGDRIINYNFIISIHAAREGGDVGIAQLRCDGPISIHAAREGGDPAARWQFQQSVDFNPRRP